MCVRQYPGKPFCFNYSKLYDSPTHPNNPTHSTSHSHGFTLSLVDSSSYSVSRPCSVSHSHSMIPMCYHWQLIVSLTYFHSLTFPFMDTHNSSLNISVSQSLSPIRVKNRYGDLFVFCTNIRALQLWVNRDVPVFPISFLASITLPLPSYTGCARINPGMKWVKVTYAMNKSVRL